MLSRSSLFAFYNQIRDEKSERKAMVPHMGFLKDLAKRKKPSLIVEIGVGRGVSTISFLVGQWQHGGRLISIDINAPEGIIAKLDGLANWEFMQDYSRTAHLHINETIDMLLIDGGWQEREQDLYTYGAKVATWGDILVHDTSQPRILQAVKEFAEATNSKFSVYNKSHGMAHIIKGTRE